MGYSRALSSSFEVQYALFLESAKSMRSRTISGAMYIFWDLIKGSFSKTVRRTQTCVYVCRRRLNWSRQPKHEIGSEVQCIPTVAITMVVGRLTEQDVSMQRVFGTD